MVTETSRAPVAAAAVMVIFTIRLVVLATVVELTVMPLPTFTVVAALRKFVPVKVTSKIFPTLPLFGSILVNVGAGLLTVKVWLFEVPTEKLRAPVAAVAEMVIFAVNCVELFTVVELTEIPDPTFTVRPLLKFVPVKTTFNVCNLFPLAGERLVNVTACGCTVKV